MLDRQVMQYLEDDIIVDLTTKLGPSDLQKDTVATQLYPEYHFSPPFGLWTGHVPIYAVLPFYRQLIVHLDPFRDQHSFERVFGISINEMFELWKRGRLILLLRTSYERYPKFYDVLLREHIPSNNRLERVYLSRKGENFEQYRDILEKRFPSKSVPVPPALARDVERKVGPTHVRELVMDTMAQRMVKLSTIGLHDRAIEIVETRNFLQAYKDLHVYNRALACPLIDALGGWDNLDQAHIELLKGTPLGAQNTKQLVLPRDVLYWLNRQMGYSYPTVLSSGTSYLDAVEQSDEAAENHKILVALQNAFKRSDFESCLSAAERSRQLLADLEKHIEDIEKTKASFHKWISRPLRYACLAISPLSFALMESRMSSGNVDGLGYGLLGVGAALLPEQIKNIEHFLVSLRHGTTAVPTIIWSRISRKAHQ